NQPAGDGSGGAPRAPPAGTRDFALLQVDVMGGAARAEGAAQPGSVRVLELARQGEPSLPGRRPLLGGPLPALMDARLRRVAAEHGDLHLPRLHPLDRVGAVRPDDARRRLVRTAEDDRAVGDRTAVVAHLPRNR